MAAVALSEAHRKLLRESSGLSDEIIDARGYFTAKSKAEVERLGFSRAQLAAPALVVPTRDVFEGEICSYQIRPDTPRYDNRGKVIKYESVRNGPVRLDVHPSTRQHLNKAKVPLFITEGIKKGDAAAMFGLCCIALAGVTMWKSGVALPDWHGVMLKGRKVYIVFDSDAGENPNVYKQMRELGKYLGAKGAIVRYVSLPPGAEGQKVGLDDFFLARANASVEFAVAQLLSYASDELPRAPRAKSEIDRKTYPQTDSGNAERLVDKYGQDIRYCALLDKWFVWSGTHWEMDADKAATVMRMAKEIAREIAKEAEELGDPDEAEALAAFAKKSENYRPISDCVQMVKTHSSIAVAVEDLDKGTSLLNLANGTLDLVTFEMQDHRREDLLTRVIDIPYDTEADCPRWYEFLNTILQGNESLLRYIWKACGYSLTTETSEKCFFFLHGHKGDNGKSTFVELLMQILGPYAHATPIDTLLAGKDRTGIPNDIARLKGVRLVSAPEAGENKRLNEELIKQLTGSDTITARFLHSEFFDFKPQFKLWMTGNYKPQINGQDPAIWNRVKLIPFTYSVPEADQDKQLAAKLYEERAGILAWMIDGCMTWRKERLIAPEDIRSAVEEYRKEMDQLGDFLEQCTETAPGNQIGGLSIYMAYERWCKANGIAKPMTNTMFGRKLGDRGIEKLHSKTGALYKEIRLKDAESTEHVYRGGD